MLPKVTRYISLGAGVQSTAMLILSANGKIPLADVAIFADTQDEPQWVYEHLEKLKEWSPIRIDVVTAGHLSEHMIARNQGRRKRFAAIPAFTTGSDGAAAPLQRQCTREYKIDPIEKHVRKLMGYKPRQRIKEKATAMIGISLDEATRMKPSRTKWIENTYPLIDSGLRRSDCISIIEAEGFQAPKKSSCIFCPYHSDSFWLDIRENHPTEWLRAVEIDAAIRNMSMSGVMRPVYLHRTLKPLPEVTFRHENQLDLFDEECEGMCGV